MPPNRAFTLNVLKGWYWSEAVGRVVSLDFWVERLLSTHNGHSYLPIYELLSV